MGFQLVPNSVTLNDLERRNGHEQGGRQKVVRKLRKNPCLRGKAHSGLHRH